ncbi:hypothetical protein LL965_07760 [Xanthomonas cassavae CFBP 4642]|uniref:Uncharacterized protein n=1 Tax=Xanthomonas cassavae CFBP 4642 TaxID=1219375 RepID=A0ABS8HDB9_9XANT|nr:hypothetical protein [Xanthomonas cassavae]MCC4619990.1 hypothetical protein [Xanthomonas cassavae CFBP 4642]
MKKKYVFAVAGLITAALITFLFMKPSQLADASRGSLSETETRRVEEDSIPGRESSHAKQRVSDWASKASDEIYRNFHDTKSRAETGDAAAQRQLAEGGLNLQVQHVS